jgi:type I restriction enzyme, R subunit
MSRDLHSEVSFETVIEAHSLQNDYTCILRGGFECERAIFRGILLTFIRATQPKEWAKLGSLDVQEAIA